MRRDISKDDKSNWHFNKFSPLLLSRTYVRTINENLNKLILGFIGLKGILHNIILIIPVILPLTGSPHVTLINVIQTLKIKSLFVHYQGSMVEQQTLLPAWKNINCTHRLCQPPFSETQGRISCRSGEKVPENFRHTSVSSPNPTDSAQGCQPPILSITINVPHHVLGHSLMLQVSMRWVCDGSLRQGQ